MTAEVEGIVEFRILGPLAVLDKDKVAVPIRGRHHPKLLAVLVSEAGRVVPTSRLVEALWDTEPPVTAISQVQNSIGGLRKQLGAAAELLETAGNGYRLAVSPEHVDVLRCQESIAEAQVFRRTGQSARALAAFNAALAEWRGPAMSGLTGGLISSLAQRLEETHLCTVEDRIELELEMGHPDLIAELQELSGTHPQRQRIAASLMLALHRAGRSPEALGVYTDFSARLADRLGVDPGRALRDLHSAILREDPSLPGSPSRAPDPKLPVPAQLPADTRIFTGRDQEFAALDATLAPDGFAAAVAVITGQGGVGKTALALRWAHRRRDRFPDGQLYVNLRGYDENEPIEPQAVAARFLRALGVATDAIPSDVEEAMALYRSLMADRRMLVVLDNASTAEQVRPLLPGVVGCLTLVTSRDRLSSLIAFDDAQPIALELFDLSEALDLLTKLVGETRLREDPRAVLRVVELCDRLPLALRIIGANLALRPHAGVAELADELDGADRLDRLAIHGARHAAVADSLALSYRGLAADTQRFFLLLGLIPGSDFAEDLVSAVTELPGTEVKTLLQLLINAHLVEQHHRGRYRFHDLVRLYAADRAKADLPENLRAQAIERLMTRYGELDDSDEYDNVAATVTAFADNPQVWKAASGLFQALNDGADPATVRRFADIGLAAAEKGNDYSGQASMNNLIAYSFWAERNINASKPFNELAVKFARLSGDRKLLGMHLANVAVNCAMRGDRDMARTVLVEALEISEEYGSADSVASRLGQLGTLTRWLGRYEESEGYLRRAIALVANPQPNTMYDGYLVELYLDTGRYAEGLELVNRILKADRDNESPYAVPDMLALRGQLRQALGHHDAGHADLVSAADNDGQNKFVGAMNALVEPLARSFSDRGEQQIALKYASELLESGRKGGALRDEGAAYLLFTTIHTRLNDFPRAVAYGCLARDLYDRTSEPLRLGRALAALAEAYTGVGDRESANDCRARALTIFESLGVPETTRLNNSRA